MTLRLTIAIDPGHTGAVALLADGEPAGFIDMPTLRREGQHEVDAAALAEAIRSARAAHSGAYISAVLERVRALPRDGKTSVFRFGEGFGKVKAVLETLGIRIRLVDPPVWKRHYGLLKTEKDAARLLAIRRFPSAVDKLQRKKDQGRADALLMALYHDSTEVGARAA